MISGLMHSPSSQFRSTGLGLQFWVSWRLAVPGFKVWGFISETQCQDLPVIPDFLGIPVVPPILGRWCKYLSLSLEWTETFAHRGQELHRPPRTAGLVVLGCVLGVVEPSGNFPELENLHLASGLGRWADLSLCIGPGNIVFTWRVLLGILIHRKIPFPCNIKSTLSVAVLFRKLFASITRSK